MHNLSGYDAHFIIEKLAKAFEGKGNLLALNKENCISFTKNIKGSKIKFWFLDSYRFMAASLEKLASYCKKLNASNKLFRGKYTDAQIELMKYKGIFPYDHVKSLENLKETLLPHEECFYSKLNQCHIADADYEHAKTI